MKLHVQCDRCKKYAPTESDGSAHYLPPNPPKTWHKLVAFGYPIVVNECYPIGPVGYLLCGDCLPLVKEAIDAIVKRGTR